MMKSLAVVATLAAVASAGENPQVGASSAMNAAMRTLVPGEALASYATSKSHLVRDEHDCGHCVEGVSRHIVHHIVEHIVDFCETATCPFIEARCEWMREHQPFVLGHIVAKVRPAQSGFAYCMGKGACEHPHAATNGTAAFDSVSETAVLEEVNRYFDSSDDFATFVDGLDAPSSDEIAAAMRDEDDNQEEEEEEVVADDHDHDGDHDGHRRREHHRFERCVGFVAGHVMERFGERLRWACSDTDRSHMRHFCTWLAEDPRHVEFVFGSASERIQPEKFGIGACSVIAHEHHEHHEHHHHGHHHDE